MVLRGSFVKSLVIRSRVFSSILLTRIETFIFFIREVDNLEIFDINISEILCLFLSKLSFVILRLNVHKLLIFLCLSIFSLFFHFEFHGHKYKVFDLITIIDNPRSERNVKFD